MKKILTLVAAFFAIYMAGCSTERETVLVCSLPIQMEFGGPDLVNVTKGSGTYIINMKDGTVFEFPVQFCAKRIRPVTQQSGK